jgi:repressor LexA
MNPTADPRPALTKRQSEILDYLKEHIAEYGYPPTFRGICGRFGITSPNGVACHFRAMEKKGYIRRAACSARAITILEPQS